MSTRVFSASTSAEPRRRRQAPPRHQFHAQTSCRILCLPSRLVAKRQHAELPVQADAHRFEPAGQNGALRVKLFVLCLDDLVCHEDRKSYAIDSEKGLKYLMGAILTTFFVTGDPPCNSTVCFVTAARRNLYCEQTYCPGELSPWVFETGERIGDIEIVRLVTVLRSAAVYAALRQGEQVYVKIAHQGGHNKERLKREAELLAVAQTQNVTAPFFPVLLPPTVPSSAKGQTYDRSLVAGGTLLYYYVFQYVEAESLRHVLRKQPQLWINHVGWISLGVATALAYMHKRARFDFTLCPGSGAVCLTRNRPTRHVSYS